MKVERETTNGVIYDGGTIVKNGLRIVCPFCGEVGLHHGHGGSVNVWTVGPLSGESVRSAGSSSTRSP